MHALMTVDAKHKTAVVWKKCMITYSVTYVVGKGTISKHARPLSWCQ